MGWLGAISAFARAIGEALGIIAKRQELNNTPDMKAAEVAKKQQKLDDEDKKIIKSGDLDSVRRNG